MRKSLSHVTKDMLAGVGIPIPGRWYPSPQQVLHWLPTYPLNVEGPFERFANHKLCDNKTVRFPEARRDYARYCDRCLYHLRRAVTEPEKWKQVAVVMNGRWVTVKSDELTYEGVLDMFKLVDGWEILIMYKDGPGQNREGTLLPGQKVTIVNGMQFGAFTSAST